MSSSRFLLALDAGGTSTRCLVATLEGEVAGVGVGGPGNYVLNGLETTRASLERATLDALQAAGIRTAQIEAVVAGCAAVGPNGEGREFVEPMLAALVPGPARVRVTGDMVTAFWGALRTPIGVVVSAGTGSVCYGRNVTGEIAQVGGWGPVMGDEGSAYDIGVQALRAVACAFDGRTEPTLLSEALNRAFGTGNAAELARKLHSTAIEREQIAALSQLVGAAAERDDAAAIFILRQAARELAAAALATLRNLNLLSTRAAVSYSGSVFEAGAPITEPFRRALTDAARFASVEAPLLPPIGGAFRLGLQSVGFAMDDPIVHRLARGLVEHDL